MIRKFVAITALAGTILGMASAASAKEGTDCPPGFKPAVTLTQALALPRIITGFEVGAYTVEEFTAQFDFIDENQDGVLCFKAVSNLRGQSVKAWGSFYLADDNDQP